MANQRVGPVPTKAVSARDPSRPGRSSGKVAITLRLDADRARQLYAVAAKENRTITNYVETTLLRDLEARDEAARVISVYAAPGTTGQIAPGDVVRGPGESDSDYARRGALLAELWSIPDSD
jgi:hypothetical protein